MSDMVSAFVKFWAWNKILDANEVRLCEYFEEAIVNFLQPLLTADTEDKKKVQDRLDKYLRGEE